MTRSRHDLSPTGRGTDPPLFRSDDEEEEEDDRDDHTEETDPFKNPEEGSNLFEEYALDREIKKEELARKRHYLQTLRQERLAREGKGKKKETRDDSLKPSQVIKKWRSHDHGFPDLSPIGPNRDDGPGGGDDGPGGGDGGGSNDEDDDDDQPLNNRRLGIRPEDAVPTLNTIRTPPPGKFDPASKMSVTNWLFKMNLWFQASTIPDNARLLQAAILLEGNALI